MKLNADFSKRIVITPDDYNWVNSPAQGVRRMMLDRIGDEIARATTIVEFAPNSEFDGHTHDGGEEFFVLEGVFSDESGDYPAGSYVRNPIGTSHTPYTKHGCKILVKLHQFSADDTAHFHVDTNTVEYHDDPDFQGLSDAVLHRFGTEEVRMYKLQPDTKPIPHTHKHGEEFFVLQGVFQDENGTYPAGTWVRYPPGSSHAPFSEIGCVLWAKSGHLATMI